jgi:hypothetical protein
MLMAVYAHWVPEAGFDQSASFQAGNYTVDKANFLQNYTANGSQISVF